MFHSLLHRARDVLLGLVAFVAATAAAGAAVQLDGTQRAVLAWPALTVLPDASHALTLAQVRERQGEFRPPGTPEANLGQRREAMWLRIPVQVQGGDGRWVFDIDYPPLNEVALYQISGGELVRTQRLGALQHFDQRPLHSRTHAVELQLAPGVPHELFLRVTTQSAMLVPITLSTPDAYHSREAARQLGQGVMLGCALALLVYSLAHWVSLRNSLFGLYAWLLVGVAVFFLDYFGILQQYLVHERTGRAALTSLLSALMVVAAGALFINRALDTRLHSPRVHRCMQALAAVALLTFAAALSGVLPVRPAQLITTIIGPIGPLLALTAAWERTRAGDRGAPFMMLGWGAYLVGALTMAALLRGFLPANALTQNLFQCGTMIEMLAWLRVLGLRVEAVRRQAERAQAERGALESLACTDPLTGLPNRRGLTLALSAALAHAGSGQVLAVFLADLDGFKPVNDRLGHDAGDELLVQVAARLKANLRATDVVARLGGDEFVIVAGSLMAEADAQRLGSQLLRAFDAPFVVQGQPCQVGLTIGFALAPHDGLLAGDLLKRADAAMYAGKQSGRHTLRRGAATVGLAA